MLSHQQIVRQSRHPMEMPLLAISALLTMLVFVLALLAAWYRPEVVSMVEHAAIASYKKEHTEHKSLSDAQVLVLLPQDEKELLDTLRNLYVPVVLIAPLGLFLVVTLATGRAYGQLRADGIKVGPHQFAKVHVMWVNMASELGIEPVPELYVRNGNGVLNAFTTCIPGYRNFGAIHSDILERALANDDARVLRFVLGHELGHVRMQHVAWWRHLLTALAKMPIIEYMLWLPLSRAQEYGCDKIGHHMAHDVNCKSLLMLAAGKHLYRDVDIEQYEADHLHTSQAWAAYYNAASDHPAIHWRIQALRMQQTGRLFWFVPRDSQ